MSFDAELLFFLIGRPQPQLQFDEVLQQQHAFELAFAVSPAAANTRPMPLGSSSARQSSMLKIGLIKLDSNHGANGLPSDFVDLRKIRCNPGKGS